MGFSSGSSTQRPVDMTPQAFRNLQQPFANLIATMIGQPNASQQGSVGGKGAPSTPPPQGTFNPNDPSSVLGGIPGYQGPLTAGITGNEQSMLNALQQQTQAGGDPGAISAIEAIMGGSSAPGQLSDLSMGQQSPLGQIDFNNLQGFSGQFQGENPHLQAMIESAQRPTLQGLEETLSRALPGRFAVAGQNPGQGGSSAFDRAAAIATRGTADALGDIATGISFQAHEAERNRLHQALSQELQTALAQGQTEYAGQLQQQLAQLDDATQRDAADQQTGLQQQLGTLQAQQQEADRQLNAAGMRQGISQQEIENTIQNLQAQALPRLIEELGIERGMQEFNNRMNNLMILLQTAGGVTRPTVATEGDSSQFGMRIK